MKQKEKQKVFPKFCDDTSSSDSEASLLEGELEKVPNPHQHLTSPSIINIPAIQIDNMSQSPFTLSRRATNNISPSPIPLMQQKIASPLDESYPSFFFEAQDKKLLTQLLKKQPYMKEQATKKIQTANPKSLSRNSHSNNDIINDRKPHNSQQSSPKNNFLQIFLVKEKIKQDEENKMNIKMKKVRNKISDQLNQLEEQYMKLKSQLIQRLENKLLKEQQRKEVNIQKRIEQYMSNIQIGGFNESLKEQNALKAKFNQSENKLKGVLKNQLFREKTSIKKKDEDSLSDWNLITKAQKELIQSRLQENYNYLKMNKKKKEKSDRNVMSHYEFYQPQKSSYMKNLTDREKYRKNMTNVGYD